MPDPLPILAYDAGPRPMLYDRDTIRLTAPSRWPPIIVACVGMTVTAMVIVGIIIGLVTSAIDDGFVRPSEALCGVSGLLFLCPQFVYCLRVVMRRARYGRDAIWIHVTADALAITNPATWGLPPMAIPLAEIEHVFVRPAGWSLVSPRIHTVFIDRYCSDRSRCITPVTCPGRTPWNAGCRTRCAAIGRRDHAGGTDPDERRPPGRTI